MRWGKPIKNKKRRDPRYFLNEVDEGDLEGRDIPKLPDSGSFNGQVQEDMFSDVMALPQKLKEVQGVICSNKKLILKALDNPKLVRFLAGKKIKRGLADLLVSVSMGSVDDKAALEIVNALDHVFGAQLEELATNEEVKPMIKQVINLGCTPSLPF